ncbi:MAG: MoaD/ThiS family protein [Candidatus Heimdallarchaeota archaeon]
MKVLLIFKGSVFEQKKPIELDLVENSTILEALNLVSEKKPKLLSLLFRDGQLRSDILVIVDKTDVLSMGLLDLKLSNNQEITILPLAHGG